MKNYQINNFLNWFSYSIPVQLSSPIKELITFEDNLIIFDLLNDYKFDRKVILKFHSPNGLLISNLYLIFLIKNSKPILTIIPQNCINFLSLFTEQHYLLELPFIVNNKYYVYLNYCTNTLFPIHNKLNLAVLTANDLLISSKIKIELPNNKIIDSNLLNNFPDIITTLLKYSDLFKSIQLLTLL